MEGKRISLITFTKKGDPIATQVWFVERDEKIFFATTQKRYKFRRIKNNQNVKIARASMRGKPKEEYIEGIARILSDEEFKSIIELFKKKYRLFKMMFKVDQEGEKKVFGIEITLK